MSLCVVALGDPEKEPGEVGSDPDAEDDRVCEDPGVKTTANTGAQLNRYGQGAQDGNGHEEEQ